MFSFLNGPFSYLMKGCLYLAGNHYILALLFFALIVQILLLPLNIKQHKSQIKMAEVKPKEMAIREKYKGRNDRVTQQKMSIEIQEMYQQSGYNQFAGCLPLLIQLPIIIVLFNIVRQPITYGVRLTDVDSNFDTAYYSQAVEYYQEQKEALDKDAFATTEEYDAYIAMLDAYQVEIGVKKDAGKVEGTEINLYEPDEKNIQTMKKSTAEAALVRFINEEMDNVTKLKAEGKLDESFDISFVTTLEAYKDDIPNYKVGPLNLINTPNFKTNAWLMIIPLLVFLTSYFMTKMTKRFSGSANQTDANGNPIGGGLFMEVGMPLLSAFISMRMTAAVGAYWIWRTLISMVQTLVFAKVMPIPVVTEEQIAEARRELKSKVKKKKVITIEVDEDDNSYDDMIVGGESNKRPVDPTQRTPRHIQMLTADDEEDSDSQE